MNHLYHVSENGGIRIFKPRAYWHINYSLSGRVKENRPIPVGSEVFHVVYGKTAENLPFYFLPRGTARLWLTDKISGNNIKLIERFIETDERYQTLFVSEGQQEIIGNHIFFKYIFEPIKFRQLPNGEWVSFEPVKPSRVLGPLNTMKELERNGTRLIFIPNFNDFKMKLLQEGIPFHAEEVFIDRSFPL